MSIQDVVHELIEVAAGRHPVLTHAEADALHEAIDQVEDKPEPAVDDAELSQEPTGDPAPPETSPAPENLSEGLYAPPQVP